MTTWLATVDADHKIEAPDELKVGARVIMRPAPDFEALLADPERQQRFAATREAIQEAINDERYNSSLTNEEIVALVKKARRHIRKEKEAANEDER